MLTRESWQDRGIHYTLPCTIHALVRYLVCTNCTASQRVVCCGRYEKLAEQEEVSSQQQRRRLFAELQAERDKMATQWEQQRRGVEQQQAELQV